MAYWEVEILIMFKRVTIAICLLAFISGCERILKVTLDGNNPPTVKFDGRGGISWIFVYQVTPEGKIPARGTAMWKLVPKKGITASAAPPITYGVVPDGFVQEVPSNGSPPALEEGKTYGFGADTSGQPGATVWFTIRDGRSVQVPKTDPPNKPY
jgi:hypothetical protein